MVQSKFLLLGLAVLLFVGCGKGERKAQLTQINGSVRVDGQAVAGVTLTIQPIERQGTIATGATDEQGSLVISTFESGDGLRPGSYQVTCQWAEFDPVSRKYKNDRLAGQHSDASRSGIVWNVGDHESQDVGEILLSTK